MGLEYLHIYPLRTIDLSQIQISIPVLWIPMGFEVSGIYFRLRDSEKACKMIICHLSQL